MRTIAEFDSRYPVRTVYTEDADLRRFNGWSETETRNAALQVALQMPLRRVVYANQMHSGNVLIVSEKSNDDRPAIMDETDSLPINPDSDALVTKSRNVLMCIRTADCPPLFLYDPDNHAAGIAHCGWRGICKSIVSNTVNVMKTSFGSVSERIVAAFGPCICADCYRVGEDVVHVFSKYFSPDEMSSIATKNRSGGYQLDLRAAITAQLLREGVLLDNIHDVEICSCESSDFASYRRNGTSAPYMQTLSGIVLQ